MVNTTDTEKKTKPRPPLFRALGKQSPPTEITIRGKIFQHERTIKHDSWAATALYQNDEQRVVCKFNRIQPIFLLPMRWLGRRLARRESAMYKRLADLPNISTGYDQVYVNGELLCNAAAHDYIDGHPLRWHDQVNDDFFEQLREMLLEIHRRGIAYVDLNKCENIIVNENGDPCLIDFQISVKLPRVWPFSFVLRVLQESDLYHLSKHARRYRPELYPPESCDPPSWIRMHRKIANPFRALRRRILTMVGVRRGKGKAQTEQFVEEGLRATSDEVKPIIQLYQVLVSNDFVQWVDSVADGRSFIEVVFSELLNRSPHGETENSFVESQQKAVPRDQVMSLLKSEVFFVTSDKWDKDFLAAKVRQIEEKLTACHLSDRAAA